MDKWGTVDQRRMNATTVVSRMLWKFPGGALRACEGSGSQAARSRGMGAKGCDRVSQPSILRIWI